MSTVAGTATSAKSTLLANSSPQGREGGQKGVKLLRNVVPEQFYDVLRSVRMCPTARSGHPDRLAAPGRSSIPTGASPETERTRVLVDP